MTQDSQAPPSPLPPCMYVCMYGPVSRVPESVSLGDHTIVGGPGIRSPDSYMYIIVYIYMQMWSHVYIWFWFLMLEKTTILIPISIGMSSRCSGLIKGSLDDIKSPCPRGRFFSEARTFPNWFYTAHVCFTYIAGGECKPLFQTKHMLLCERSLHHVYHVSP